MLIAVNFHYVRESYDFPYKAIFGHTPETFRSQIETLSKHGTFVSQEQIIDCLESEKNIPSNSILVTFDDGLQEQHDIGKQILTEMGVPALYFVNPSNVVNNNVSTVHQIHLLRSYISMNEMSALVKEKTGDFELSTVERSKAERHYNYDNSDVAQFKYTLNFKLDYQKKAIIINELFKNYFGDQEKIAANLYMGIEQLKSLSKSGELGSHTFNHLPVAKINLQDAEIQINKAQDFFKKEIGRKVQSISFPYGSYESVSKKVEAIAENAEIRFGFTMERAANKTLNYNPLFFGRYDCNDVPGGKNNLFNNGSLFKDSKVRSWKIK